MRWNDTPLELFGFGFQFVERFADPFDPFTVDAEVRVAGAGGRAALDCSLLCVDEEFDIVDEAEDQRRGFCVQVVFVDGDDAGPWQRRDSLLQTLECRRWIAGERQRFDSLVCARGLAADAIRRGRAIGKATFRRSQSRRSLREPTHQSKTQYRDEGENYEQHTDADVARSWLLRLSRCAQLLSAV